MRIFKLALFAFVLCALACAQIPATGAFALLHIPLGYEQVTGVVTVELQAAQGYAPGLYLDVMNGSFSLNQLEQPFPANAVTADTFIQHQIVTASPTFQLFTYSQGGDVIFLGIGPSSGGTCGAVMTADPYCVGIYWWYNGTGFETMMQPGPYGPTFVDLLTGAGATYANFFAQIQAMTSLGKSDSGSWIGSVSATGVLTALPCPGLYPSMTPGYCPIHVF